MYIIFTEYKVISTMAIKKLINLPLLDAAIAEALPLNESSNSIARICQKMSHGLSTMSSDDPFLVPPAIARLGLGGGGQRLSVITSTAGINKSCNLSSDLTCLPLQLKVSLSNFIISLFE